YWALFLARAAPACRDELALTAPSSTAEEAFEAGIITRLAPPDKHPAVARELALQVAKNPPLSVRTTVRTRRWYMERLTREAQFIAEPFKLYLTEAFQEAARAFTEKRPPHGFKGR